MSAYEGLERFQKLFIPTIARDFASQICVSAQFSSTSFDQVFHTVDDAKRFLSLGESKVQSIYISLIAAAPPCLS